MTLERGLKVKAERMAKTDGLPLVDFLGQLVEAEHRQRHYVALCKATQKAWEALPLALAQR